MNRCDNCGELFTDEELRNQDKLGVENIADLEQRLDPGCEVPSGECPFCGALTYILKPETITVDVQKAREMLTEWHVDENTDYKVALGYAVNLIERLRKDCAA